MPPAAPPPSELLWVLPVTQLGESWSPAPGQPLSWALPPGLSPLLTQLSAVWLELPEEQPVAPVPHSGSIGALWGAVWVRSTHPAQAPGAPQSVP